MISRALSTTLLLLSILASGCAMVGSKPPAETSPPPAPEAKALTPAERLASETEAAPPPAPPTEGAASAFGKPMSLEELLRFQTEGHVFSLEAVYLPPDPEAKERFVTQLAEEELVVPLAKGVTAWIADDKGLAIAQDDGVVRVFGQWPCPSLVCAQISETPLSSRGQNLAVAPGGHWQAVVDEVYDLWTGPIPGQLRKAARLRYANLALSFTPKGNLLLVVDQVGWVTVWDPATNEMVHKFQAPDGPFESARQDGRWLRLKMIDKDQEVVFDLAQRKVSNAPAAQPAFFSQGKALFHRSPRRQLVKKVLMGAPELAAWVSTGGTLLKVQDLDGKVRFYDLENGRLRPSPESATYEPVALDSEARGQAAGKRIALADCIFQKNRYTLMARRVPDVGFFLWWTMAEQARDYDPRHGELPIRESVLSDEPEAWRPVLDAAGAPGTSPQTPN